MLEHNYALGHLLQLKPVVDTFPKDAHKVYTFGKITQQFPEGAYLLDVWPLEKPFLIVANPTLATQATQTSDIMYNKPPSLIAWFLSIAGGPSLFDVMDREQWKPLRAMFNPGFSANHLNALVPSMIEMGLEYCSILRQCAKSGELCYVDPITLRFILDLMGKIIL